MCAGVGAPAARPHIRIVGEDAGAPDKALNCPEHARLARPLLCQDDMRTLVLTVVVLASSACAHGNTPKAPPAADPLPALSVQRELEQRIGYQGAPGTMDFLQLRNRLGAEASSGAEGLR